MPLPLRSPRQAGFLTDPNTPLLGIGGEAFTLGMAYEGVHIFGGTGSGKSSGSMAALARAYLCAGMGGLVLCAKPGEAATWQRYAQQTGREDALIVIDGSGTHRFNFLDYELHRPYGGELHNLVELFLLLSEAVRGHEKGGGDQNPFWKDTARSFLKHSFALLMAAGEHLRLQKVSRFLSTLPKRPEQASDAAFLGGSYAHGVMERARSNPVGNLPAHDLAMAQAYFHNVPSSWDDRTTGNVDATISSMIDSLLTGTLHTLFCTHTNVVPEMAHHGAVFVIDLPIKHYKQLGRLAGLIWKYLFQQAAEARIAEEHAPVRPVFLAVDEAANFFTEYDNEFQSTARSARACSLYATQNIGSYYRPIGGHDAAAQTEAFLGNFRTKIFHSNDDPRTNEYASQLVGRVRTRRANYGRGQSESASMSSAQGWSQGRSYGPQDGLFASSYNTGSNRGTTTGSQSGSSESFGWSEQMEAQIEPNFFSRALRTGGTRYRREVDALWFRPQADGGNWRLCTFKQR